MPITKSAKKKLRKDRKRTLRNVIQIKGYKTLLKKIKKGKGDLKKLINEFYSKVDKCAKKKIIHKNKANRLKARVMKQVKKIKEQQIKK